jgi:ribonuclease I
MLDNVNEILITATVALAIAAVALRLLKNPPPPKKQCDKPNNKDDKKDQKGQGGGGGDKSVFILSWSGSISSASSSWASLACRAATTSTRPSSRS